MIEGALKSLTRTTTLAAANSARVPGWKPLPEMSHPLGFPQRVSNRNLEWPPRPTVTGPKKDWEPIEHPGLPA